ncbi:MAG TPA: lysylphosphatidylglycerol synthase transmembrane domain-containing protein [Acidimicrobiales bacterium]
MSQVGAREPRHGVDGRPAADDGATGRVMAPAATADPGRVDSPPPEQGAARRRWLVWGRRLVGAALVGAAIGVAVSRRHELGQAIDLFGRLRWGWLVVAVAFEALSLVAFARLQRWLLRAGGVDVGVGTMVEITLAGNALAMSLPGGAAWSAAWAFGQLRRRGAERVLAGWVVLMAGALASYALFLLLVVGALVAGSHGPVKDFRFVGLALALIPFAAGAVAVTAHRSDGVATRLRRLWRRVGATSIGARVAPPVERLVEQIQTVRPTPLQWAEAFGLALLNWLETCACLAACIIALGGHVPWRGLLVAYTLAQVAASLPITPGGLGVVEGSLTALLVAYGLKTDLALATVLLFRAVSFWGLVPVGWATWGALTFSGRHGSDGMAHPWATHPHRRGSVGAAAPDRLLTPPPCRGCE